MRILLFTLLIIILISCSQNESVDNCTIDNNSEAKFQATTTTNDVIFKEVKKELLKSAPVIVVFQSTYYDEPDSEGVLSLITKTLGYSNDKEEILEFIYEFPIIGKAPDTVEFIRCSAYSHIYFICKNDTLIDFNWDPGRNQIHSSFSGYHKIDFSKLDKVLDIIKLK
ncbi:MAG: hypothetical protein K8R85_15985 [Bacteroidetes bacterium]|nr:hypothetical protein [Bacteroidota bacterium]